MQRAKNWQGVEVKEKSHVNVKRRKMWITKKKFVNNERKNCSVVKKKALKMKES